MKAPNFRTLDLNLLRVFDQVMTDRNLTRAARNLAMTQPAVSNSLGRLREALGDRLVTRSGFGVEPTPRALALWPAVSEKLVADLKTLKMGDVMDFTNFINAVIDEKSFDKLARYIDAAKNDSSVEIIAGGNYDKSVGYLIEPTVIRVNAPGYVTMCEELFGPVLTVYVYEDDQWEQMLKTVDETSPYALIGAVFARDRAALQYAERALVNSAGNFYLNDKPTGAVVGQQPFGGARASGTNDKAGSYLNLLRWVSARSIKETLVPPTDYRYPFLTADSTD